VTGGILVAGIGNVFLRDDGFGVEVARRLAERGVLRGRADVVDFGIRGFDLALALSSPDARAAILVDIATRGGTPGTLYVLEPDDVADVATPDGHGLDPVKAIAMARALGGLPPVLRLVACEPSLIDEEAGLSTAVEAAVERAITLVCDLVREHGGDHA
jgi:hydrogenase maturation protease